MPMPTLGVMTAKGKDPMDKAGGATGFGQKRALPPSLSIAFPGGVQDLGRTDRLNCLSWILNWSHCWSWDQRSTVSSKSWLAAWRKMTEKANLPTLGQPHLLAGSILELREAMKGYVSFPNDAIFGSMALPDESLTTQLEKTVPQSAQPASTNSPVEKAAVKVAKEEAAPIARPLEGPTTSQTPNEKPTRREHPPNQFPGWREVLHPSRLVTATRQIPLVSQSSKWRSHSKSSGERMAQY